MFPNEYRKISPLDPQILFAGQWFDDERGLAYNRFRYYDPESGNYISSDPIGLNGGETPYSYVHNPVGFINPFGLAGCRKDFYSVAYEMKLSPKSYPNISRARHFQEANEALLKERGQGLSRKNPAIAIKNNPLHKEINRLQRKYGLYNPSVLRKQTALSNINKNAAITRRAITEELVGRSIDRKSAKSIATKYVNKLRNEAINFVKTNNIISCRG